MNTQTIFQAGNSHVVALSKDIMAQVGFKPGQKIIVDLSSDNESILISKPNTKVKVKTKEKSEFNRWLKAFMAENGEILDELAER